MYSLKGKIAANREDQFTMDNIKNEVKMVISWDKGQTIE